MKKSLKLWLIPAGIGFGILISYLATKEFSNASLIIFMVSIVLWLAHELYKNVSGYNYNIRHLASSYHDDRGVASLAQVPIQKCDCCDNSVKTIFILQHNTKPDVQKSICFDCYIQVIKIRKRIKK